MGMLTEAGGRSSSAGTARKAATTRASTSASPLDLVSSTRVTCPLAVSQMLACRRKVRLRVRSSSRRIFCSA